MAVIDSLQDYLRPQLQLQPDQGVHSHGDDLDVLVFAILARAFPHSAMTLALIR